MEKLTILWTTDNEITIKNMIFMYSKNALLKGWFNQIKLIVWGASSDKLANDTSIQKEIKEVMDAGVEVLACLACANNLGVADQLQSLGIEVKYVGQDLTDILKSDEKLITV